MPDREKVIKGLNTDVLPFLQHHCDMQCDREKRWISKMIITVHDALVLLKEQEAKPMIENERGWNCPSCGIKLIGKTASGYPCDLIDLPEDEPIHFCPMCGQAVKWE